MKLRKFAAILMAALLMLTLCVTPIFADEDSSAVDSSSETVEETATDSSDDAEEAEEAGSSADAEEDSSDDETETDDEEEKEINWDAIIAGGIVVLAIIVLAVIYFVSPKFHERVNKFARDYRSELKKIVWSPLRDVKKNTVVVLVLSLFFVIIIGLLDWAFNKGIVSLKPVISSLLDKIAG